MQRVLIRLRKSWKAALLHLSLSSVIALSSIALVFGFWYPGELSTAQGVSRIVMLMIGINFILGPMITSIVFHPEKRGIRFDIAVIVILQVTALIYGLYTIYRGRPVYVVFNVNRFDVIAQQDMSRESLTRVPRGLEPHMWAPRFVGARLPKDAEERSNLLFAALEGGPDLPQLPKYYVPLERERITMLKKLQTLDELKKLNDMNDAAWQRLLDGLGRKKEAVGYLPLLGHEKDGAVILDRRSAEIIGIRMLTPRFGNAFASEEAS